MDAKITLSFDKEVIEKAKEFAAENGFSLSRLTELIYRQMTSENFKVLEELPIASWVNQIAEERPSYGKSKPKKELKSQYFDSKK